jgi:hypothetical protein
MRAVIEGLDDLAQHRDHLGAGRLRQIEGNVLGWRRCRTAPSWMWHRALAAARGAEQPEKLTGVQLKVDLADGDEITELPS